MGSLRRASATFYRGMLLTEDASNSWTTRSAIAKTTGDNVTPWGEEEEEEEEEEKEPHPAQPHLAQPVITYPFRLTD